MKKVSIPRFGRFGAAVVAVGLLFVLFSLAPQLTYASDDVQAQVTSTTSPFYKFTVIAQTKAGGLTKIQPGVSINDKGNVAFIGTFDQRKQGIFISDGSGDPKNITPKNYNRDFGSQLQLNTDNQLIARDYEALYSRGDKFRYVRRWDGNNKAGDSFTTIARGDPKSENEYRSVGEPISINNKNQVVFASSDKYAYYIATPRQAGSGFNELTYVGKKSLPLYARIADDGHVLVHTGTATQNPILLYDYAFQNAEAIATKSDGWKNIGLSPAISSDGQIVVFYGDIEKKSDADKINNKQQSLTYTDGTSLQLPVLTPGEGIFASVRVDNILTGGSTSKSQRVIVRISGKANKNGNLEPWENWYDKNNNAVVERGEDIGVSAFSNKSSISVNSTQDDQRSVVIAYSGSNYEGKEAIFTTRLNFFHDNIKSNSNSLQFNSKQPVGFTISPPTTVIKLGQTIDGLAVPVTKLGEVISTNSRDRGDVAFWVEAGSTEAVLRARRQEVVYLDFAPSNKYAFDGNLNSGLKKVGLDTSHIWDGQDASFKAVFLNYGLPYSIAIQDAIVKQVQEKFNNLKGTSSSPLSVNVKIIGAETDVVPIDGPFIRVFIGLPSNWKKYTSSTKCRTLFGVSSTIDLYNQNVFSMNSSNQYVFLPKQIVSLADSTLCRFKSTDLASIEDTFAGHLAHEIGHSLGLHHLDNSNAPFFIMRQNPDRMFLRMYSFFENTNKQLAVPTWGLENSGARLAFSVGSDNGSELPRVQPDPLILLDPTIRNAKLRYDSIDGTHAVKAVIVGVLPHGDDDIYPTIIDLGSGNLESILNTYLNLNEDDKIFVIASTDGQHPDIFGLTSSFSGDLSTVQPLSELDTLGNPDIQGNIFDAARLPVIDSLHLFQVTSTGTKQIGRLGNQNFSVTLQSIVVKPTLPSIGVGSTQQFEAIGTYSDGRTRDITAYVTWASNNSVVASITSAGLATAVSAGQTTISAILSGITGSTTLTITNTLPTLQSIAITPNAPTLVVGGAQQFTATGTYSNGSTKNLTQSVTWTSSASGVAIITSDGLATAVNTGTTTIKAKSGGIESTTVLTVGATLQSIAVTPASSTLSVGGTQQFTATSTYSDGTTRDITASVAWSSSMAGVATINSSGLDNCDGCRDNHC